MEKLNLQIAPLSSWLESPTSFPVIAGPCSAETQSQVMDTAKALAQTNKIALFRAGVWKPRSRPHSFAGGGEAALDWLVRAREETKIPVAVEVANASHVHACLKKEIDVLWIGARTVVNPFSVQEIADALKGVDIPVLIKNPLVVDLELWIGALERMNQAGIQKLAAVHRGFATDLPKEGKTKLRYSPSWHIPLELKRLCPNLPILCDPSHIAGNTRYLLDLAKQAVDLKMEGLMIESHVDPENAFSDADQQLTPKELNGLLEKLHPLSLQVPTSNLQESVHNA